MGANTKFLIAGLLSALMICAGIFLNPEEKEYQVTITHKMEIGQASCDDNLVLLGTTADGKRVQIPTTPLKYVEAAIGNTYSYFLPWVGDEENFYGLGVLSFFLLAIGVCLGFFVFLLWLDW